MNFSDIELVELESLTLIDLGHWFSTQEDDLLEGREVRREPMIEVISLKFAYVLYHSRKDKFKVNYG